MESFSKLNVLIPREVCTVQGGTRQGKLALRTKSLLPGSLGLSEDSGSHAVPPGGITLARIGQ